MDETLHKYHFSVVVDLAGLAMQFSPVVPRLDVAPPPKYLEMNLGDYKMFNGTVTLEDVFRFCYLSNKKN